MGQEADGVVDGRGGKTHNKQGSTGEGSENKTNQKLKFNAKHRMKHKQEKKNKLCTSNARE